MDTGMRGSLNLKYFLYMIKTTHFSDEPFLILNDMKGNFSEENLKGIQLPSTWTYCFNEHCPHHQDCIRYITGKYVDDATDRGSCVFPNACRNGRTCRFFKQARVVTFAWGFDKLFYNVRQRDSALLRTLMKSFLGSHSAYYRYADGRHKLTPEQQKGIIDIFRKRGYNEDLVFDHYVEEPDLT